MFSGDALSCLAATGYRLHIGKAYAQFFFFFFFFGIPYPLFLDSGKSFVLTLTHMMWKCDCA